MSSNINMNPNSSVAHSFANPTLIVDKESAAIKENSESKNIQEKNEIRKTVAEENEKQISNLELEQALDVVSSFINTTMKHVNFSSDDSSGKMVIKVIDRETQEIIQQFPSEKIVSMAIKIKDLHQEVESISGLLIDSRI